MRRKDIRKRLEAIRKYNYQEEGATFPPPPFFENDRRQKEIIEPSKVDVQLPAEIREDVDYWNKR